MNLLIEKNLIINLLTNSLLTALYFMFFKYYFNLKFSVKKQIITIIVSIITTVFFTIFTNYTVVLFSIFLIFALLFIFLLKNPIMNIITYFSLQSIVLLNVFFVNYCIINLITKVGYNDILESPIFNILNLILLTIINYIAILCSKKIKFDNLITTSIEANSRFIISSLGINFIFTNLIINIYFEKLTENTFLFLFIDSLLIVTLKLVFDICYSYYQKLQINNLKLCNKNILNICDETRAFRHDFHNIIQAMGGFITTNNFEGLKQYYEQLYRECINSTNLVKINNNTINNPAIYNILVDKYYLADNNDIKFTIDVMLDLNKLNIRNYECTRILGILLDNAIEASKECSNKLINICFKQDKYKQMIVIENTYANKDVSIDKIFEKDFSTKPNNTGLGLWEVRRILNKNSNLNLHTSKNDEYFSQALEIYAS